MSAYMTRPVEPVEVDARQVSGGTAKDIAEWCGAVVYMGAHHGHTTPPFKLHTCLTLLHPDKAAYSGHWVVRFPDGHFDVLTPAEFADRFEPVHPAAQEG